MQTGDIPDSFKSVSWGNCKLEKGTLSLPLSLPPSFPTLSPEYWLSLANNVHVYVKITSFHFHRYTWNITNAQVYFYKKVKYITKLSRHSGNISVLNISASLVQINMVACSLWSSYMYIYVFCNLFYWFSYCNCETKMIEHWL